MSAMTGTGQLDQISKSLKEPFDPIDVEWRVQAKGATANGPWARVLAYVSNRAIQKRLDELFTPFGWRNEYAPAPVGGVMCGISIKNGTEWVTKWDGAENTNIEAVKGGLSDSMKRCAVQWGIGRYLYYLDATYAQTTTQKPSDQTGWHREKGPDNKPFWWKTPDLPNWALPKK
jgi:hypothetical protein